MHGHTPKKRWYCITVTWYCHQCCHERLMKVTLTVVNGINHMLQFNGPPCQQPLCCSFMNPNKHWLETISVPSFPLCQWSHRDTGHYTQAHLSWWSKWQFMVLREVCVCVFGDIWSFSFSNKWGTQKTEHETRHQAQAEWPAHLCPTHTHTSGIKLKPSDISETGLMGNEIVSHN